MTPSDLKYHVEQAGTNPHFFDRKTMKFWGDRMANYGCRSATIQTRHGEVECWELYRKKAVKHGLKSSSYFCKRTFERVFPEND